jgi:Domain of unknown function (DUF5655)
VAERSVEALFEGRPGSLRLFRTIRRSIERLGEVELVASKSQVSFRSRRAFAWVWLPQRYTKNRPPASVTLTIGLDHEIVDERIAEAVQPKPGHWTHHIVIERSKDFDATVKRWLREAYEQAG